MPNTNPTPNMNLPVPVGGVEGGFQATLDIATCFNMLDGHNHTPGSGVQITPGGLNINTDLPFGGNNALDLRSARLNSQGSALSGVADLGCLYNVSGDLYYNDGSGNQVRITQSGGVVGSPGSISGLSSPASATYVSANSTFVWQSAANTPATLDFASAIFRNLSANSKGLTLQPPASMGSNYTLTLPSIPGSTSFITIDSSGNLVAGAAVSGGLTTSNLSPTAGILGSQLAASANIVGTQLTNGTITNTQIAGNTILHNNIAPGTILQSNMDILNPSFSTIGTTSTTSSSEVTAGSASITTSGGAVLVSFTSGYWYVQNSVNSPVTATINIYAGATLVSQQTINMALGDQQIYPAGSFNTVISASQLVAGANTITIKWLVTGSTGTRTVGCNNLNMALTEL